jgi:nucleoside-triphosphatase THEP1
MDAHVHRQRGPGKRLVIVTGPSGSGKTTTCRRLISASSQRGLTISGLTTVIERTDAGATRWVQDLRSSQRRLVAREVAVQRPGGPRWRLVSEGLLWGDQVLAATGPTDVLVID